MIVLLLVAVVSLVGIFVAAPLFEFVAGVLLLTPLLKFFLGYLLEMGGMSVVGGAAEQGFYFFCFGLVVWMARLFFGARGKEHKLSLNDWLPLMAFSAVFVVAYALCMQWREFYALGERLRDYALIASAIDSPVVPKEPWMEGYGLNYYVFWYRFAAMLSSVLAMDTWNVYHSIVAFSLALYGAAVFQVVRVVLGGNRILAWCAAVGIPFLPNVAGMLILKHPRGEGFSHDEGWWGPSRVIVGSITEFPAWSFILGDAHPHYLNLATFSILLLFFYRIVTSNISIGYRLYHGIFMVLAGVFFLIGSNAWEVPMWGGMALMTVLLCLVLDKHAFSKMTNQILKVGSQDNLKTVSDLFRQIVSLVVVGVGAFLVVTNWSSWGAFKLSFVVIVACLFAYFTSPFRIAVNPSALGTKVRREDIGCTIFWIGLLVALKLSSSHIRPEGGGSLTFVGNEVPVTTTLELFVHWGWQLALLAIGSLVLRVWSIGTVLMAIFLGCTLLYDKGALFLYALIGIQLVRIVELREESVSWKDIFGEALVICSLGLILLPEFVFLNDSYGGDNERMNTIFKIYTTSWALVSLAVVYIWQKVIRMRAGSSSIFVRGYTLLGLWIIGISLIVGGVSFYAHTLPRRFVKSDAQFGTEGLSDVERKFSGSAEIIRDLRNRPYGRVLEAQGKPYSFTSFVSTLAGQPAYLGWSNHVGLLTRERGEIARREKITKEIYTHQDCLKRQQVALQEKIAYIVVGDLEQTQHRDVNNLDFSCMKVLKRAKNYVLYKVS